MKEKAENELEDVEKLAKDYVGIKMEGRENTKINIESEEIPQGYGTRTE